jgi:hypothetical protein
MRPVPPAVVERRKKLLRKLGIAVSALMVLLVVAVFALIVRSESAHDEAKCPFARRGQQQLDELVVIEEARRCVPEAEERRWLIARAGKPAFEFARKRLPLGLFTHEETNTKLVRDEQGLVVLTLNVRGLGPTEFREVDAPDRQ